MDMDGNMESILGAPIEMENADHFLAAMNRGNTMVSIGMEADGKAVLIYGLSVGYPENRGYPLSNGKWCTALLAGIPIENLSAALSLGADESLIFTNIVGSDGSFIINNSGYDITEENCYDWLLKNGREANMDNIEEIVAGLREAVSERKPYRGFFIVNDRGDGMVQREIIYTRGIWNIWGATDGYNEMDNVPLDEFYDEVPMPDDHDQAYREKDRKPYYYFRNKFD